MARGISTIIGTLLFLLVASLLLALALRTFSETALALNEVVANHEAGVEQLEVRVEYTAWKKSLARDVVSSIHVISGSATSTDPRLLDIPDGNAIVVEAERVTVVADSAPTPASEAQQLIRNGEFDDEFNHWSYSTRLCSWSIASVGRDKKARCTCSGLGADEGSTFIQQTFTLTFNAATAVLSFEYSSGAGDKAQVFLLVIQLKRDGQTLWFWVIDLLSTPSGTPRLSMTGALASPGVYTLNFSLIMAWKGSTTFTFTLDKVSLTASPQPPPPQLPLAYYQLSLVINTFATLPQLAGRLALGSDATAYIELYRWIDGGWALVEKSIIPAGATLYLQGFEGKGGVQFLLVAYAQRAFKLTMDHFDVKVLVFAPASVRIANIGTDTVDVYSVWLRNSTFETRLSVRRILAPGETLNLDLGVALKPEAEYEIRVVTATRTHVFRFTASHEHSVLVQPKK